MGMLNEIKNTVKNTLLYSVGNISGKLSGIILLPLYTKFFSLEQFGLLALLEVSYQFIQAISGFGIKSAIARFYWDTDTKGKEKSLFYTSYIFNIIVSFITIIFFFLIIKNFSHVIFKAEISRELTLIFLSSAFLRLLVDTPMLLLRIQQKAFRQTTVQIIVLVITVALTVYFIGTLKMQLEGIFLAHCFANLIALFFLSGYIVSNIKLDFSFTLLKELIRFGLPLYLSNLLTIVLVLSDRFILNLFGTLENVGNYSLAYKISNIIQIVFVTSFLNAYIHIFYKQMSQENIRRFYSKSMTYFSLVIIFVSTGLILFAKETIKVLSINNPDYWNSFSLIPVLVLGIIFGGIRQVLVLPLSKLKKTRIISGVSITVAGINFILNILLIPAIGTIGAAVSTAVAQIVAACWLYYLVLKNDAIEYEIPKIIKCLIIAAGLYTVSLLINDFALVWRLMIKSVLLILFFYILYLWNFFEKIELNSMKGFWRKWSNLKNLRKNISEIRIE